jgi:hypothetical protein
MSFKNFVAHGVTHSLGEVFSPWTRSISVLTNNLTPSEIPDISRLMELAISGWISEKALTEWAQAVGVSLDPAGVNDYSSVTFDNSKWVQLWNQVYWARQELPTPEQAFVLTNRGVYRDVDLHDLLRRHGFYDEKTNQTVSQLRYEVPGPSDLVRFAVRHIFEPDLIKELGYPDERDKGPFLLDIYHQAAGINYPIFTGPLAPTVKMVTGREPAEFRQFYADAGLPEPTWADAYWWAHWVLPSPMQAYEMYFKLRPDRDRKFDPPEALGQEFPYRNLDLLLRANDYPPKFRPLLAAIARPLPGIRFIRQLRAYEVYSYADVLELFKRMGYAERDARDLADAVEKNDQAQKTKGINKDLIKEVIEFVRNGMVTDDVAKGMLTQAGVDPAEADKVLQMAHVQDAVTRTKEFVRTVKSSFVKGRLSQDEARRALQQFGLVASWIEAELAVWAYSYQQPRREITAQQAVRYACQGLISVDQLQARLTNLGYSADDVVVLIGEAQVCAAGLAAKALAAQQRQQDRTQRALKQQQRDAARAIAQARQELARHGSPAQLRKWYCEGHLGSGELYSRLRALGWPDPDIGRLIADCKQPKQPKGGPRGPAAGGNPTATGP